MRIVHISDLHLRDKQIEDQRLLIDPFLEHLIGLHQQTAVDLIVFSGDLTFSSQANEYSLAKSHFLSLLTDRLSLSNSRVVLVHGNHDNDIARIDPFQETGLRGGLKSSSDINKLIDDKELLQLALRRRDAWLNFTREWYSGCPDVIFGDLERIHTLSIEGATVSVAALDSAWRATGEPDDVDRAHLVVGDRQWRRAFEAVVSSDIRLVTMHHPLDWLAEFERPSLEAAMRRVADILLTGHVHLADTSGIQSGPDGFIHSVAGSLFQGREMPNSYCVLDVDINRRTVTSHTYAYQELRSSFAVDESRHEGGTATFPLNVRTAGEIAECNTDPALDRAQIDAAGRRLAALRLRTLVQVRDDPAESVHHAITMAREFLADPVLLPLPFDRWIATESLDATAAKELDLDDLVEYQGVLVLGGDGASGVSSTIDYLCLLKAQAAPEPVLPLRVKGPLRSPRRPVWQAIRRELLDLNFQGDLGDGAKLPRSVIGLEGMEKGRHVDMQRIAEEIGAEAGSQFIWGCQSEEAEKISDLLSERGIEHRLAFLGKFGRSQIRALVSKLGHKDPDSVVARVSEMIAREGIARTPMMLNALVAVVVQQPTFALNENETSVLQEYVDLLLGRGRLEDSRTGLDYRSREFLLSELAGHMVVSETGFLPRANVEEFFAHQFGLLGWNERVSHFIDALISSHVLAERGGEVFFRHRSLIELFAAKHFIEDPAFREHISADLSGFATVVTHAASLMRTDLELLREVLALLPKPATGSPGEYFARISVEHGWADVEELLVDAEHELGLTRTDPAVGDPHDENSNERSTDIARQRHLEEEFDAEREESVLDEMWNRFANRPTRDAAKPMVLSEMSSGAKYRYLLRFTSSTLRVSELVKDPSMKVEALGLLLGHWADYAALLATWEQENGILRESLSDFFGREDGADPAEYGELIDRVVLMLPVITAWSTMQQSLSSTKLALAIEELGNSDDFLKSSGQSLMLAALVGSVRPKGWTEIVKLVYENHRSNRVIRESIRFILDTAYASLIDDVDASRRSEEILSEITCGRGRTPADKARRARYAQGLREFRSARSLKGK